MNTFENNSHLAEIVQFMDRTANEALLQCLLFKYYY